jgi:F0F1-type ATP synthase membrane subunit b/b'
MSRLEELEKQLREAKEQLNKSLEEKPATQAESRELNKSEKDALCEMLIKSGQTESALTLRNWGTLDSVAEELVKTLPTLFSGSGAGKAGGFGGIISGGSPPPVNKADEDEKKKKKKHEDEAEDKKMMEEKLDEHNEDKHGEAKDEDSAMKRSSRK